MYFANNMNAEKMYFCKFTCNVQKFDFPSIIKSSGSDDEQGVLYSSTEHIHVSA